MKKLLINTIAIVISFAVLAQEKRNFSIVLNPEVPKQITFANQKIDLDRIDMWERLDRELTSLTYTHGSTLLTLKRANRFFPILAPILKENGLPLDFLYLACTESMLDTRAYSPAKAAGLWQFIPATGKAYGLEINEYVDERLNIEKATIAACKYLKESYKKYGNWESVACAYNAGNGRITSELTKQQVTSSFDLHLVSETSRYMFRILAYKIILENPRNYGFFVTENQLYQPIECDIVEVNTPISDWPTWAKEHGITYAQLREQNPWIQAKYLHNRSGKVYKVKVPKKESLYRSSQKKNVYNTSWIGK
ncbi:MAG: lytic transglycosylase domain-containing protein [Muribaculaceae bacterium]|nr:lytic transglycosylase domain-containing protein [Muribaculaceae bacterium]